MPTLFQICVEGNTGSTGRIAEEIGIAAIQNSWTSYIAYGRFPRPSKSNLIRIGTSMDIIYHGIITRLFDKHGLGSTRATRKLIDKIVEIKPDVIHLHHLHGYYININILFNYLSNAHIPIVWTFHDCWSLTGHCTHFDYIGCEKWKTECHHCPQKKDYPKSIFIDHSRINYRIKKALFTSVRNMTIVNVSNWMNCIVGSSFMSNVTRKVINNGIDINNFSPQDAPNKIRAKYNLGNKFIILGVARDWRVNKGLNHFLELSKMIGADDVLILVGLNGRQIKNIPLNIIALTKTENPRELAELYSTADVYLNLSFEETFGLTTAEALACGTPAIVYNATACPEVVDKDTGIVIEINDFKGILRAIETIKKNGKNIFSEACRARVLKYFNKEDRIKEYIDLYQRLTLNES